MAKAIDNIRAWAKENVQLITILPENENLQVKTRLKDVLETSVDEKYYLSDEKTALLVAKLEEKLLISEAFILDTKPKDAFRIYKETCPTLQANDYKEPKQVVEIGIPIREATKQGYALAVEGDAVNFQFPNSATRRGRVGKQIANTLEASGVNQGVVEQSPIMLGHIDLKGHDAIKRVYDPEAIAPTLTTMGGGHREPKIAEKVEVKQLGNVNPSGRGMNGAVYDIDAGLSPTLTTNKGEGQRIAEAPYYRIRKLTPLECFRLQSFPDWTYHEAAEVNSNSQLYRQAGNSVTVNVIHEMAKRLN